MTSSSYGRARWRQKATSVEATLIPYTTVSDKTRLYYEDFGEGSAIVFVGGGGATHGLWEQQVYALADEFRTITYDHRGSGNSDKPRSGYTVDRLADDLFELVSSLSLASVTGVSHGFGGHILLRCVKRHPNVVDKIVLCAAAPWFVGDKAGAGGFSKEFLDGLTGGIAANYPQADWDLFENWMFYKDPGLPMKIAALAMAQSWPAYVHKQLVRDLARVDHREYLPEIRQKTLVVHGIHDRKNRYEGSEYLADMLPNARLVRFEKSAHAVYFDELALFNDTVARFVREIG